MSERELVKTCDRSLSAAEARLLRIALELSAQDSGFIEQIPKIRVLRESSSAWPILEFGVAGRCVPRSAGMHVLADLKYQTAAGLFGFFVYAREGLLAGMECWSIDGRGEPDSWPPKAALTPLT